MCRNVVPSLICVPQMTSLLRPMALTSTEKLKLPENTSKYKNEAAMQASFRGRGQISPPPRKMVSIMCAVISYIQRVQENAGSFNYRPCGTVNIRFPPFLSLTIFVLLLCQY